jgi:hypothetical protein
MVHGHWSRFAMWFIVPSAILNILPVELAFWSVFLYHVKFASILSPGATGFLFSFDNRMFYYILLLWYTPNAVSIVLSRPRYVRLL